MKMTEILKRIWLFYANKTKSSESISKQPTHRRTQFIIVAHNCHISIQQTFFSAKANKLQKDPLSTDTKKEEEHLFIIMRKKSGQVCMSVRTICVTIP